MTNYISSWFKDTAKTYDIFPSTGKRILKLYKKRIKDNKLVEIGYQTSDGWKLHKVEPTPKFIAEFLSKRNDESVQVSSYYPGTYTGDEGNLEIMTSNFPEEIYVSEKEVTGFIVDDCYVYYDDFEHPSTVKKYYSSSY